MFNPAFSKHPWSEIHLSIVHQLVIKQEFKKHTLVTVTKDSKNHLLLKLLEEKMVVANHSPKEKCTFYFSCHLLTNRSQNGPICN